MISIKKSESKYPKLPCEVVVSNGKRSGIFAEHITPPNLKDFPKILIKDTDVMLITYGRSGTTVAQLLLLALMEGKTKNVSEMGMEGLLEASPYLELYIPGRYIGQEAAMEKMEDPYRVIKTHLPRWLAPSTNAGKKVFVTRDVKDTLVSFFHFYHNNKYFGEANNVDFNTFYEMFLNGHSIYSDWFEFYRDWLDLKSGNEIWLRYEDLVYKFDETVKKLAAFLKVELTDSFLEDLRDLVKVETMKKKFTLPHIKDFVRKGIAGDHANYLTKEQIKCLDEKTKEMVSELCFE